jgi:CRISPR-associated protein Csd1
MTILSALNGYYDRLAARGDNSVPPYGYSYENISCALILAPDGTPLQLDMLEETDGNKVRPKRLIVPQTERSSDVKSKYLWDNTSYVFGVSEKSKRISKEHAEFVRFHQDLLGQTDDEGLRAFLSFLSLWTPDRFHEIPNHEGAIDKNLVFRLDGELRYLHERPAATTTWAKHLKSMEHGQGQCLVTGGLGPVARLHPSIKGVLGAQTSGAPLSSADKDGTAFHSYNRMQGNAGPVSQLAAFSYTSALNKLLERGRNRIQIGDATTVFWAEAPDKDETPAEAAETFARNLFDASAAANDEQEAVKVGDILTKIKQGRPLKDIDLNLHEGTRFYLLGLSPNAARLSVRFWYEGTLGELAGRFRNHWNALSIEPAPWRKAPAIWRLLYETAAQRKAENIPPLLAGELMRAILTGVRYPRALLSAVTTRLRADHDINGMRAAICKACLIRNGEEVPVSLDKTELNPGYRLGRLFAVLEGAQRAALGKINATIRDRYYGAASATPASIFPVLLRNAGHHLSNLRKDKGGLAHWFETEMGEIMGGLNSRLPSHLRIEDQGRFAVGYYHQRFSKRDGAPVLNEDETENESDGEE